MRLRRVGATWPAISLQFRGWPASTYLPILPAGAAHRGAHREILVGELRWWVARNWRRRKVGRCGEVRRGRKGRQKFHVRVGNLNKQTVRARFKNGLVSRRRNRGTNLCASSRTSASPNLRDADIASTPRMSISSTQRMYVHQYMVALGVRGKRVYTSKSREAVN